MAKTASNENLMAALSYLGFFITGIIFLLLEKKSDYVRFHAMQSTILFGGIFVINMVLSFIIIIGWIAGYILSLIGFILWIVLMWKAFNGERYKVPVVGDLAEKQLSKIS